MSNAKHGRHIGILSPSASAVAASVLSHFWFPIDNFRRDASISFSEGKHIKVRIWKSSQLWLFLLRVWLNCGKHGHVAYQIEGNDKYSKMQAHILSLHTPSTPGERQTPKQFIFLK